MKEKLEERAKWLMAEHMKTIFYNEGDLDKLQENIKNEIISAYNLGIETAANHAQADFNIITPSVDIPGTLEVYVIKNSILNLKIE